MDAILFFAFWKFN